MHVKFCSPPKYEDCVCQSPQSQAGQGMDKSGDDGTSTEPLPLAESERDVPEAASILNHCQDTAASAEQEPPSYSEIFHQD